MIQDIIAGFAALGSLDAVVMLLIGNVLGYLFGILPGLAGLQAMALVLPFTFGMEPLKAMYLYSGIMGSCTLSGAVTAILINTPGTPSNIATTIEGNAMTKRGEATQALAISSFSSMFGTFVGLAILILVLPFVKYLILNLRAPEIFWIIVLGLLSIAFVVRGNVLKGIVSALMGVLFSLVGTSQHFPVSRFDLGITYFRDGINLGIFFVGVFGISEIMEMASEKRAVTPVTSHGWKEIMQGLREVFRYPATFFRSSVIGTIIGIIPGLGGSVANTIAYTTTVRLTRLREGERPFGTGNREGLVACESANNAKDGGALLTTVTFGIPGSPEMAILLGAFVLHGLQPGLLLVTKHGDTIWVLIFGLFFSQFITVIWTLMGANWFARITTLPPHFVSLPVLLTCFVGAYALHSNIWDVFVMAGSGFLAYGMKRFGFPAIAMAIGFVLGATAETSLMQSLSISLGSASILFTRPVSLAIAVIILLLMISPFWGALFRLISRKRQAGLHGPHPSAHRAKQDERTPESQPRLTIKTLVSGVLLFELGLLFMVGAFLLSSARLDAGPGTFPFLLSAVAFSLLILIVAGEFNPKISGYFKTGLGSYLSGESPRAAQGSFEKYPRQAAFAGTGGMAVLIIIFLAILFFTGFFVAVPLCFLVYLAVWQKVRWTTALLFSALISAVLFFGFDNLLQHNLWKGAVPEIIPGWVGGETVPVFF